MEGSAAPHCLELDLAVVWCPKAPLSTMEALAALVEALAALVAALALAVAIGSSWVGRSRPCKT